MGCWVLIFFYQLHVWWCDITVELWRKTHSFGSAPAQFGCQMYCEYGSHRFLLKITQHISLPVSPFSVGVKSSNNYMNPSMSTTRQKLIYSRLVFCLSLGFIQHGLKIQCCSLQQLRVRRRDEQERFQHPCGPSRPSRGTLLQRRWRR